MCIDLRSLETISKWFTWSLNICLKIQDGCHDIFYSMFVRYYIIIWSHTEQDHRAREKSKRQYFIGVVFWWRPLITGSVACICHIHVEWQKWDHWKCMDVGRKHIWILVLVITVHVSRRASPAASSNEAKQTGWQSGQGAYLFVWVNFKPI